MVCPRQVPDLELNEGAVGNICITIENKNIIEFQGKTGISVLLH